MSLRRYNIRKMTYEDKFDRYYACFWKRGARHIKRENRRKFRRKLKKLLEKEIEAPEEL